MPISSSKVKFDFQSTVSLQVLQNFLSRSISMLGLAEDVAISDKDPETPEMREERRQRDIELILYTGAKFIGRAGGTWGEWQAAERFAKAAKTAALLHKRDPEIILQTAIYEYVTDNMFWDPGRVLPAWIQAEFGAEPTGKGQTFTDRRFNAKAMRYDNEMLNFYFEPNNPESGFAPDMTKKETQMWFYYCATRYIDAGFEAIHFGQVHLMNKADVNERGEVTNAAWWDLLTRIRKYAAKHARRGVVLCDAHTHGIFYGNTGNLLFDFHSAPLRIKPTMPPYAIIEFNYLDSIYGKSKGGMTPLGYFVDSLPYLVEFDNYGRVIPASNYYYVFGLDEISWFGGDYQNPETGYYSLANKEQPEESKRLRNEWLAFAWHRVRQLDPRGFLQMPGRRVMSLPDTKDATLTVKSLYRAGNEFHGQENTIKELWEGRR